jgi:hypothetical protein
VAEKTMSQWAKQFNWREKRSEDQTHQNAEQTLMKLFFAYLTNLNEELGLEIKKHWIGFLNALQSDIETKIRTMDKRIPM